jgi:acetyl esterase/lipase
MPRRTVIAWLTAAASACCSRAAYFAVNLAAVFGPYTRHTDLAYGDDPQHRLDVYVPDKSPGVQHDPVGAQHNGVGVQLPIVVFWHGGRWSFGDKRDYRFVGAALAGLGCVAVLPNYRHYPQVKMPGFMEDAARATLWVQAHAVDFHADPQRLFLMGHSAGAHLAALASLDTRYFASLGSRPSSIAGVIGLSGPYDFLPLREDDVKDMFGPPPLYPESQPINFVRAGAAPMLLVHGLSDNIVSPRNSSNLAAALHALGVPVTLKLYPKLSHEDTVAALSLPLRRRAPILADIGGFIEPRV